MATNPKRPRGRPRSPGREGVSAEELNRARVRSHRAAQASTGRKRVDVFVDSSLRDEVAHFRKLRSISLTKAWALTGTDPLSLKGSDPSCARELAT